MTVLVGTVIAAGAALTLVSEFVPQAPGDRMPEGAPLLAAALPAPDDMPADVPAASMPELMAPTTPMPDAAASPRAQSSCDEPAGAFLMPQCRLARSGKSPMTQAARSARHRAATLWISQDELGAAPQQAAAETAMAATAMDETPPLPPERPAAPANKPVKIAHKRAPSPVIASTGPTAPPPSPGFDLFGLLRGASRPGTGAWAMSR